MSNDAFHDAPRRWDVAAVFAGSAFAALLIVPWYGFTHGYDAWLWLACKRTRIVEKWERTELRARLKEIEDSLALQRQRWRSLMTQHLHEACAT